MTRGRAPLFAMIAAGLSLVVAVVAVVIVVTRDGDARSPAGIAVDDGELTAADALALHGARLDPTKAGITIAAGEPGAAQLGLRPGDTIVAIAGMPVDNELDYQAALAAVYVGGGTSTLYVEIDRGGVPVVIRRRISGDVQDAWAAKHAIAAPAPVTPAVPSDPINIAPPPPPDPDEPDPLDGVITKIDDTHYKVDRAKFKEAVADPAPYKKGARVVPSIKNGKANGLKLYAIRPTSVFARLGFANGDGIHRINGDDLTTIDSAIQMFSKLDKAKTVVVELTRRGKPVTLHYTIK